MASGKKRVAGWGGLVAAALVVLPAASAFAHPLVDEGQRQFESAEFAAALNTLVRAERAPELTLAELQRLFELRARVHAAMGHADLMRADLARLVSISPEHELARGVDPDVEREYVALREQHHAALGIATTTSVAPAGVTVDAHTSNDWAGVVRDVRVAARVRGESSWQRARNAPLLVRATSPADVEYYAEAIGPGGVLLAGSGSEHDPLHVAGAGDGATPPVAAGGASPWPWILAGVGAALVVGAIVLVVVLAPAGDVTTQVSPFTVRF